MMNEDGFLNKQFKLSQIQNNNNFNLLAHFSKQNNQSNISLNSNKTFEQP